jgi:DNA-directed RNA polymerase specialized sigma24 family protein
VRDLFGRIDVPRCEALADRAAAGDANAWKALVVQLWPALPALVRASRSMGPLGRSEEDVDDVVTKLIEKLGGKGGHGLTLHRAWRDRHPDKTFEDWLRIVITNAVRDHLRAEGGVSRRTNPSRDPSAKRLLNEFAASPQIDSLGVRPQMTAAQTARQLLQFAKGRLPAAQLAALTSWIAGADFADIQAELGLMDPQEAAKLVRAAVAVLRREFATDP